jgi:hypothetical protein
LLDDEDDAVEPSATTTDDALLREFVDIDIEKFNDPDLVDDLETT